MERELHALRAVAVEAERQLAAREKEHGAEVRGSWVRGMLMRHPRHSCVNPASSLLHAYNHFCSSTKKKNTGVERGCQRQGRGSSAFAAVSWGAIARGQQRVWRVVSR